MKNDDPRHESNSGVRGNALLPGTSFAFLPADMVSQILNFGVPAPIDLQVIGNDPA
jgi:hypothetical protein